MVLINELEKEIKDVNQIYEEKFGLEIDQSAIYENVYFHCVKESHLAIVLTPICLIVTKETQYVTVARITPAEAVYYCHLYENSITSGQILGKETIKEKTKNKLNKRFIDIYIGHQVYEYHFLPKQQGIIGHSFICFEMVQTMHCNEIKKHKKIAVLKSPWRESVPSRYAAFCLRIGTPNYSDNFNDSIIQDISSLKSA